MVDGLNPGEQTQEDDDDDVRVGATEDLDEGETPVEEEEEEGAKPKEEEKATGAKDVVEALNPFLQQLDTVRGEVSSLKERNAEMAAELVVLRSRGTVEEEEEEEDEPDDKILEKMRKDPVGGLKSVVGKEIGKALKGLEQRLSGQIGQSERRVVDSRRDEEQTAASFPELAENKDFLNRTRQIHRVLVQDRGGDFGGALFLAASTAYAELVRKGEIVPNGKGKVEEAGKPSIREKILEQGVASDTRKVAADASDPLADFSAEEKKGIKNICKRYGITEKQWVKRFSGQRKGDNGFGRIR